ncbi:MAG: hypothetical protein ACFCU6_00685 [Balneolaceae bacterium]
MIKIILLLILPTFIPVHNTISHLYFENTLSIVDIINDSEFFGISCQDQSALYYDYEQYNIKSYIHLDNNDDHSYPLKADLFIKHLFPSVSTSCMPYDNWIHAMGCINVGCPNIGESFCGYKCVNIDGCEFCYICKRDW